MSSDEGPVCISVINMKGGVGKTTVAAMLCHYSPRDLDVLAIDLDPQANLSQALMGQRRYQQFLDDRSPSIVEVCRGYRPPVSNTTSPSSLNFESIPLDTNPPLGGRNIQVIASRFDFSDNLINSVKPDQTVLAQCIADHFQEKDVIIIDCAPTESVFTQVAYHASRYILVPVRPEYFATIGFPLLRDSLCAFERNNLGHQINVAGIVINDWAYSGGPERLQAMHDIREAAERNRWHIFDNEIPFSTGFPKRMRGNFTYSGNAPDFSYFATEFYSEIGFER